MHIHLPDRGAFDEAADLMTQYGDQAVIEAAMRAERSRSLGNSIHFSRWRAIERTILMLSGDEVFGSVH